MEGRRLRGEGDGGRQGGRERGLAKLCRDLRALEAAYMWNPAQWVTAAMEALLWWGRAPGGNEAQAGLSWERSSGGGDPASELGSPARVFSMILSVPEVWERPSHPTCHLL